MLAVAGPNSENVVAVLKQLTSAINGLTSVATGIDPEKMQLIFKAVAALGAGLVVLGAVSLASLVALASVPSIIIALSGALGIFAALNWESIKANAETIKDVAMTIIGAVPGLGAVAAAIGTLAQIPWQNIVTMFDGIRNALMSFIGWLESVAGKVKGIFSTKPTPDAAPTIDNKSLLHLQRFNPGTGGQKREQYAFNLNIDGDRIAQTIIDKMEDIYSFPTGAPSPDGSGRYFAGDHNFTDV
ncbi:hypothetical protein [Bradyrhizobium sp. CCBAU 051011]|uniref:hypothetical protein n=1 Tax=Bradyrhizobium sp. CCBAU 051011 TaxID=858422 RepID=UPI00137A93C9|nr:hypothetical protein [Bradyrhizobium sp. CCBAU 051011]